MKFDAVKILSLVCIVLLVVNVLLFSLRIISVFMFWTVIVFFAVFTFWTLPVLRKNA